MINAVHPVLKNTEFMNWPNDVKLNTTFLYLSVTAPLSLKTKSQVTLFLSHTRARTHTQTCIYTLHYTHQMHAHTHHMHTNNSELFFTQTQKGSNERLLILTRTHSMQIFGEIPFIKPHEQQINGQK